MARELRCPAWRKSSYSSSEANCVQVALGAPIIGIRDSKNPDGTVLAVPAHCWSSFPHGLAAAGLGY